MIVTHEDMVSALESQLVVARRMMDFWSDNKKNRVPDAVAYRLVFHYGQKADAVAGELKAAMHRMYAAQDDLIKSIGDVRDVLSEVDRMMEKQQLKSEYRI